MIEPKRGSDNAGFDVHQTDPARLKSEIKKDLGGQKWRWECNDCGNEVVSSIRPKRCPKCGGFKWIKLN